MNKFTFTLLIMAVSVKVDAQTLLQGDSLSLGRDGNYVGFNAYYSNGWKSNESGRFGIIRLNTDGRFQFYTSENTATGVDALLSGQSEVYNRS